MRLESSFEEKGPVRWPDTVAYREAIQHPMVSLDPLDLRQAQVQLDRQGLPLSYSGRFAIVFRLTDEGGRHWALRCFTTPADSAGVSRHARYHLVAQHLDRLPDVFVPFRFLERGIRIGSKFYPAIAMEWADGIPLGKWVETHRQDPARLRRLAGTLGTLLTTLETARIAHGDWQHDNLLIAQDGSRARLVDYDAVFVPELEGYPSPELGHPNYQHPARNARHFGVGMDRFACLVIQTALLALAHQPDLWTRFGDGESLLFKAADFRDPAGSRLLGEMKAIAELDRDDALAESLARLEDACRHGADSALLPAITEVEPQPIPLPEPGRFESPPVVGARWWQSGARPLIGQRQATADAQFPYLARLERTETRAAEAKHLWLHRAIVLALGALLLTRVGGLTSGSWTEMLRLSTASVWVALALLGGYREWPRRRIYDEITAAIGQMDRQILSRKEQIASRTQGIHPTALRAARGTVDDYVAERMGRLSIDRILADQRITPSILQLLYAEGIETALELRRRTTIAQVPPHQIAVLQAWCRGFEAEFADEWQRETADYQNDLATIERLELESAEFEREAQRLERERTRFPSTRFGVYLRRLIGLPG